MKTFIIVGASTLALFQVFLIVVGMDRMLQGQASDEVAYELVFILINAVCICVNANTVKGLAQ